MPSPRRWLAGSMGEAGLEARIDGVGTQSEIEARILAHYLLPYDGGALVRRAG